MEVSQKDWKLARALIPQWQEAYMERLCISYIELLNAEGNASDRFWELDKRLRNDKKSLGVSIEMRKSVMSQNLAEMVREKIISLSDLHEFSKELQDEVKYCVVLENRPFPRYLFEEPKKRIVPLDGDEIFVNGVFRFNISALLRSIENGEEKPELVRIAVSDWTNSKSADNLLPEHIDSADLNRPVLLLEIAPDYLQYDNTISETDFAARGFVLADGSHRISKACRNGVTTLPAYVIKMETHFPFLYQGYREYMDYWNKKLSEREKDYFKRAGY